MEPIHAYTSIKIGGLASVVAFPDTCTKLIQIVDFVTINKIKHKIIGRMTNILPCDELYNGILISMLRLNKFQNREGYITSDSGVMFSHIISSMLKRGYGGAEALISIPGTVGGMIYSNAGAYGSSISDFLIDADVYFPLTHKRCVLTKDDLQFGYRTSFFKKNCAILLSAKFLFQNIDISYARRKIDSYRNKRKATQPISKPSLGSVFKSQNFASAGELIDKCGLKGMKIGGAEVSKKHAGFIINSGNATSCDVKNLIDYITKVVYDKYGIILEKEIEFL